MQWSLNLLSKLADTYFAVLRQFSKVEILNPLKNPNNSPIGFIAMSVATRSLLTQFTAWVLTGSSCPVLRLLICTDAIGRSSGGGWARWPPVIVPLPLPWGDSRSSGAAPSAPWIPLLQPPSLSPIWADIRAWLSLQLAACYAHSPEHVCICTVACVFPLFTHMLCSLIRLCLQNTNSKIKLLRISG